MLLRRMGAGALLVLALVASGCSGGRDALTIYSGRDEALVGPLLEEFVETSGIDVDIRYGDSGDLALLIAEEGENTPADVFFSQSPGSVDLLAREDRLRPMPAEMLTQLDERFVDEDGLWVGITARQRVLVYNEELVRDDELPDSVLDLTDPEYRGRVGVAPPNGSFQDFVTAMRHELGDDATRTWLEGMAENDSPTFPDNNSIVDAVARGEIEMGLVNHYYNYRYLAEDAGAPSRNYTFPDGDIGSLLIEASVGILASTERPNDAERFVRFLLDESSQEYFAENTFEYPLAPGVPSSEELPPLESLDPPDVDVRDLGDLRATVEMIESSGLD